MIQNEGSTLNGDDYLKNMVTEATEQFVMFAAIAKAEGIEVTDEDIEFLHAREREVNLSEQRCLCSEI